MNIDKATASHFMNLDAINLFQKFPHFAQCGQTVAGVRVWSFRAMHGADEASTFT